MRSFTDYAQQRRRFATVQKSKARCVLNKVSQNRPPRQPEIAIDARWLRSGGLGTYTYNLIAGLARRANGCRLRAIIHAQDAQQVAPFCERVVISDSSMYTLREQLEIPWAARGVDLLHVPHYNAPLLHRGALLVSVHDLIHITDGAYKRSFGSRVYARPMLSLVVRKAEHIITVSNYSKWQIMDRLGVPSSKVTTIYSGVDATFRQTDRKEDFKAISQILGIRERYVLYVGSLKLYKNVSTLLRAFSLVCKRWGAPQRLLIIGDDERWRRSLIEQCVQLGIGNMTHFIRYVSQELLPKVYAGADLLVMPSTLEGFGLPVLEAMACGTPVICSQAAALPEVGGDAVLYFDPASPEELAAAIERLLGSTELQENLRAKGLKRAKQFTWEDCTRRHIGVYRQILGLN